MVTLGELYVSIEKRLEELFPEDRLSARLEAELIVEYSTGYRRTDRVTDPQAPVSEEKLQAAQDMLSRRLDGEPVQYIIGETGFYDMMFFVGEGVLIPRQDTEVLVETAEAHIKSGMLCADLCAGSGCIGLTLCERTGCDVRAYELSDKAMEYLKRNHERNRQRLKGSFEPIYADVLNEDTVCAAPMLDAIVSNPPYLSAEDMSALQKEVTFEPEMALYGGEDGLDFYREMIRLWTCRLKSGGFFAVEVGIGQAQAVCEIFIQNGIEAQITKDYCGVDRVVYGLKK